MSKISRFTFIVLSLSVVSLLSSLIGLNSSQTAAAQTETLQKKGGRPHGVMLLSCVATDDASIVVQASSSSGDAPISAQGDNCAEALLRASERHCKVKNTKGSEDGAFYTMFCKGDNSDHDDDDD